MICMATRLDEGRGRIDAFCGVMAGLAERDGGGGAQPGGGHQHPPISDVFCVGWFPGKRLGWKQDVAGQGCWSRGMLMTSHEFDVGLQDCVDRF